VYDIDYCNNAEWVVNGRKRKRFPAKYDTGIKGELKNMMNPEEVYEHFLDDRICELTAQQKINEEHC
jgi:hypothetical protein